MSQRLADGSPAPDFSFSAANGEDYVLSEIEGKVLLSFFRYAGCPVCNFRMHELGEDMQQLTREGYTVVAIFESPTDVLDAYAFDFPRDMIIVGDPEQEFFELYGVEKSIGKLLKAATNKEARRRMKGGKEKYASDAPKRDGSLTRVPAEFIVEDGVLRKAHYGEFVGDHLPMHYVHQY